MEVQDPVREGGQRGRADDSHVARQHDQLGRDRGQRLGEDPVLVRASRVVAAWRRRQQQCLDPLLHRPVQRRALAVGEDQGDLRVQRAAHRRRLQRAQVAARSRNSHRDPMSQRRSSSNSSGDAGSSRRIRTPNSALPALLTSSRRRPPRPRCRRRPDCDRRFGRVAGTAQTMPRPPLNVERSSGRRETAETPISRMTEGIGQLPGNTRAPSAFGQHPRHVAGQAAAGDVGYTTQLRARFGEAPPQPQDRLRVDARRRQQNLAERAASRLGLRGGVRAEDPAQQLSVVLAEVQVVLGERCAARASSRWSAGRTTASRSARPQPAPRSRPSAGRAPRRRRRSPRGRSRRVPSGPGARRSRRRSASSRPGRSRRRLTATSDATRSGKRRPTAT